MLKKMNFDEAVEWVNGNHSEISEDDLLKLYARFKKVRFWKPNPKCPSIFRPKDRAKWIAWNSLSDMSVGAARSEYVEIVKRNISHE